MNETLGARIRRFREASGLTQKELAQQLNVGGTRISNWEKEINRPSVDMLAALCRALEVSADELLGLPLPPGQPSAQEQELLRQYRAKPALQQAVRILLGMEP